MHLGKCVRADAVGRFGSAELDCDLYRARSAVGGNAKCLGRILERKAVRDERRPNLRSCGKHLGSVLHLSLPWVPAIAHGGDQPDLLDEEGWQWNVKGAVQTPKTTTVPPGFTSSTLRWMELAEPAASITTS
jgi:hypothetical protein